MKNIYEVLQQKEADIERLKGELRALNIVAPLLEEEPEVQVATSSAGTYPTPPAQSADGGSPPKKPIWPWGRLKRERPAA
jgi:hypothetical protein